MPQSDPASRSTERPNKRVKLDLGKPLKRVKVSTTIAKAQTSISAKPNKNRATSAVVAVPAASGDASQTTDVSCATPSATFKVVAGSYEKLLYGLEGSITNAANGHQFHLKPIFIFPAHVSCIKAVAASPGGGKWLATGSADEIIKVWDLRRRKEIGGLMHHEGSITHLSFPSRSYLLSASEDGTLCLFHARDWSVLRTLKGHKGRVNSVAVHPSGKVALSVGKDKTLRMWDLMRGKGSASMKLGKEGEIVRWSTDGSRFVVQAQSTIDLYTTDTTLLHTVAHPSRLHDVKFCRPNGFSEVLLAAAEDGKLSMYDVPDDKETPPKIIAEMIGHSNRVKAVESLHIPLPSHPSTLASETTTTTILCTISSDGKVHIYDLASLPTITQGSSEIVKLMPAAVYDTNGTRLTCVTLADGNDDRVTGKRKKVEEEAGTDGEREQIWDENAEDGLGHDRSGDGDNESDLA